MIRFILLLLLFLVGFQVKSQIGYEDFYSDQDLESNLKRAKTSIEHIDACGILAIHYKTIHNDSLADLYFNKIFEIPNPANNVELTDRAMWWDMKYSSNEEKAHKYLQFAEDHNSGLQKMVAHLFLSEYFIHSDLPQAEKHILIAKDILDTWERDTLAKDSIRLVFYYSAAHVYVHKRDGVRIINYLLSIQDYAEQDKKESLKISAISYLSEMYTHWTGQEKKALVWAEKLYEYFKKTNQPNQRLFATFYLALVHVKLGNKDLVDHYFEELENLRDSLHAYGFYQTWVASNKFYLGLLTTQQMIQLLDNHFNHHLFLHPDWTAMTKAQIYNRDQQWDSLGLYLAKVKDLKGDSALRNDFEYHYFLSQYHVRNKDYDKAIVILNDQLKLAQKEGNLYSILSTYYFLILAQSETKDYKTANEYLWDYIHYRDSLVKLDNKDEVASRELQNQLALQEEAYQAQQFQEEAEQARIALRNKYWISGLFAGSAVLLLIAGLLWRNNKAKQKSKLEIMKAYQELKTTQAQLIQSEKMASLGELTAGIAHEIQNPLNFVNNFSEVNQELLGEMKEEIEKGNLKEVQAIANDVIANEEKINHHGKRADAIVKGMLQHSRNRSGVKEPTNINALADEYLRLAYHGLRAKDKSFNAKMLTDFDQSIGLVNVIPQDIGRVILNLITNAFYAVCPPPPEGGLKPTSNGYEPTVTISTRKLIPPLGGRGPEGVEIRVIDNGPGIPSNVLDKIFQPFFTTKPTGQGTGLGLSLSYDIVKAHGGDLTVKTKEGEGTEFVLLLPLLQSEKITV